MKIKNVQADNLPELLPALRALIPSRPLRLYEHLLLAERQGERLHELLGQTGPAASLNWLLQQDKITVVMQPRWKMDGLSGMSTWDDGRWVIGINKGNPHARRRFTLAHEFKHCLDSDRDKITYRHINPAQREQVADYFAACYLMPKMWLRRAWTSGIQHPEALAGLFVVSLLAMEKRLRYLGFVDAEPERPLATYFRGATPVSAA